MVEVGKSFYFMIHAYHHFIGTVVKILGPNMALCTNVRRIQSSTRGWTEFFKDGFGPEGTTNYTIWPDKAISWFDVTPWNHPIPKE